MNPIPTPCVTEVENYFKAIEEIANSTTRTINILATSTLEPQFYMIKRYPQMSIIILAKNISKLPNEQRTEGNIRYDWDTRFNRIPMPEGYGMQRIILRPLRPEFMEIAKEVLREMFPK